MTPYLLRLTAANHALGLVNPEEYAKFADHFLDQGVYTPLAELLMTLRPDWREAPSLFERTLRQLGMEPLTEPAATDVLVRHFLWGIAEGVWPALDGAARFTESFYESLFGKYGSYVGKPTPFDPLVWPYYEYRDTQALVEEQLIPAEEGEQKRKDCEAAANEFVATWMNQYCLMPADPGWLTWQGGTVLQLAQSIRNELAFDRLPILGDALEEAGCTQAYILDHCRDAGPHVGNCWVIDLLLDEE